MRIGGIILGVLGEPSDWLMGCSLGTGNKNLLGKELYVEYSIEKELWDNEDTTSITLIRDNDTEDS
ncbi:MAG: hypothetical protein WA941_11875 [Nitrososphaeraceae archaeon]